MSNSFEELQEKLLKGDGMCSCMVSEDFENKMGTVKITEDVIDLMKCTAGYESRLRRSIIAKLPKDLADIASITLVRLADSKLYCIHRYDNKIIADYSFKEYRLTDSIISRRDSSQYRLIDMTRYKINDRHGLELVTTASDFSLWLIKQLRQGLFLVIENEEQEDKIFEELDSSGVRWRSGSYLRSRSLKQNYPYYICRALDSHPTDSDDYNAFLAFSDDKYRLDKYGVSYEEILQQYEANKR